MLVGAAFCQSKRRRIFTLFCNLKGELARAAEPNKNGKIVLSITSPQRPARTLSMLELVFRSEP
jgi:hypothetical protein